MKHFTICWNPTTHVWFQATRFRDTSDRPPAGKHLPIFWKLSNLVIAKTHKSNIFSVDF